MTTSTMLSNLGIRLNDVPEDRFTQAIKLAALNSAQDEIASICDPELLKTAQAQYDFTAQATGTALPSDYFRYINSKLRALSPIKFITKVDMAKASSEGNRYLKGTDASPTCHIWNNLFYLNVTTFSGDYIKVRLYYIHTLTTLTSSVNSDLDPKLHPILLDLVEGQMRANAKLGNLQEALGLQDKAYKAIDRLSGIAETRE